MAHRLQSCCVVAFLTGSGLSSGCPSMGNAAGAGAGGGDVTVTRVAGEPLVVQRLAPDAAGGFIPGTPLPCAGPRCLIVRSDVVAVQTDRGLWVRLAGEADGRIVAAAAGPDEPEALRAVRTDLARAGVASTPAAPKQPAAPTLPRSLRTCGTVSAGGGFGYHIIRNDGDVWQRVEWMTPPTAPEILALAPDAYPIVDGGNGSLCAWGEQRHGERRWTVHHAGSATVVEAVADREHVPARCPGEGRVDVDTDAGVVRIAADGTTARSPAAAPGAALAMTMAAVTVDGKATLHMVSGVVVLQRPGGTGLDLTFQPGTSLDGVAVPVGLQRERVIVAGDGKAHVAVVERFVGGGRGLEVLQVVRVDGEAPHVVSTPVRDDVVIARLSAGLDGFWWVEGPATVIRMGD